MRAAADASPASWLLRRDVDWMHLVRLGPPGFAAYVRIALPTDLESDPVRDALSVLAGHTTTPDTAYAAVWEGWAGTPPPPGAPRVPVPNRTMLLFTGPVEVLRDAPALMWEGESAGRMQEPHLVWPEDRAWCLACEVDEEIELSVGCTEQAADALGAALPGRVRRVSYGDPGPLYSDEA
ncbi:hypothetical protein [Nocardioides sediminis]|uniref:hypothetical protein n=1 Tax=Nocardioides sediminis TaxID=433648 RepID=UPI00131ED899|nr:hypothetical protein [Nocardioides sediminis]